MNNMKVAALVLLGGVSFVSGWKVAEWRLASEEADRLRVSEDIKAENRKLVDQIAKVNQEAIANIRIENRTIYQKTRREVIRDPVYVDCVVPTDGSRMLNQARSSSRESGPESDDPMPADSEDPEAQRRADRNGGARSSGYRTSGFVPNMRARQGWPHRSSRESY